MTMTPIDIRYLSTLLAQHERGRLEINTDCPECGDQLPESYLDVLKYGEIHTVLDLREERAIEPIFTVVIGCEGYHIMDSDTGKIKDHS